MRTRYFLWLFVLSLLGAAGLVSVQAHALPERVATHFDLAGQPDGWMTRGGELAFFLSLVTVGLPLLVAGFTYLARFHGPEALYVPNGAHWRSLENHPKACAILFRFGLLLGAALAWWSAALHARLAAANRADPPRLDGMEGLTAILLAGVVVWFFALWLRFRRIV